jgi:hypothetical protein
MKLPSLEASKAMWAGDRGAIVAVMLTTLARSTMISLGVYFAGAGKKAWLYGAAGSLVIEAAVIAAGYYAWKGDEKTTTRT